MTVKLRRTILILIAVLALALIFFLPGLLDLWATIYTDWLWFDSLGYLPVYQTRLVAQVGMYVVGAVVALAFAAINWILIPRRLLGSVPEVVGLRIRRLRISRLVLTLLSVVAPVGVTLVMASWASSEWSTYLFARHSVPFGLADPIFGLDAAFYVFKLPFYLVLVGWLISLTLLTLVGTAISYGGRRVLRWPTPRRHLAVLIALFLFLLGIRLQLSRLAILDSARGVVFGAGYTDIHARLPLYHAYTAACYLLGIAVLVNVFARQRWPLIGAAGLTVLTLLVGSVYPAFLQRYVVAPNELAVERPYIESNIAFTRYAFGLEDVKEYDFPAEGELTPQVLEENALTVRNIRLWDWRPLLTTYGQLQEIRLYYTFNDVDVDRYVIDGHLREVMLAARELDVSQLPEQAQTWVNRHLVFTHGYGLCLSPVNEVTEEGMPHLLVRDLPPRSADPALEISQPAIYFGESTSNYVIVDTAEEEFDYPRGDENIYTRYEGPDGVMMNSLIRRIAFAIRFGSSQILFSGAIQPESRILFHRALSDRVWTLAPLFWYDPDPYPVIAEGRLIWLYDAYTWTDRFPYSEPFQGVNYIRNSVKVAIDAYTGETTFYVVDPDDPIVQTYQAVFPDLFTPVDEMPQSLRDHWRYPEQLFRVQAEAYAAYHMEDPQVFYNKEDLWDAPTELFGSYEQEMAPYYVVMQLPGEEEVEFLMIRPYVPSGRRNMIAWLYADSDGPDYGELGVFKFPKQELIYGPMQVEARFDQDPYISQQLTLWNQQGSEVIRGNMMVIPIDDTVIYVEPLYLQAQAGQLPELKRVMVAYGNRVAMSNTLEDALAQVLSAEPTVETPPEGPTEASPSSDVGALIRSAWDHYQAAQECLRAGDWACYGREMEALGRALEALVESTGQ